MFRRTVYLIAAQGCALVAAGCGRHESKRDDTAATQVGAAAPARDTAAASSRGVPAPAADDPGAIIRRYYAAIQAKDYAAAYALWGQGGSASHQSYERFAAGFAHTVEVHAALTDSIRIEGAAGSQYATVPVVVSARLDNGERQRFTGTYTLRRAMVDGATTEQRRWHIEQAQLVPARD